MPTKKISIVTPKKKKTNCSTMLWVEGINSIFHSIGVGLLCGCVKKFQYRCYCLFVTWENWNHKRISFGLVRESLQSNGGVGPTLRRALMYLCLGFHGSLRGNGMCRYRLSPRGAWCLDVKTVFLSSYILGHMIA